MGLLMKLKVLEDFEGRSAELFDRLASHFGLDEELALLFIRMGINGFSHQSVLRYLGQLAVKNPRDTQAGVSMDGPLEHALENLERLRTNSSCATESEALQAALQFKSALMEAYADEELLGCLSGFAHLITHLHAECRTQIKELQTIVQARAKRMEVRHARMILENRQLSGR